MRNSRPATDTLCIGFPASSIDVIGEGAYGVVWCVQVRSTRSSSPPFFRNPQADPPTLIGGDPIVQRSTRRHRARSPSRFAHPRESEGELVRVEID